MAIFALVGMFAYLGLAVLGWGRAGPFFTHPIRAESPDVFFRR
jgi:hypothetical protein